MKIEIVFIKDHFVGLKKGTKKTFLFLHAARLIDEGWAEPTDKDKFDAMAAEYSEQQESLKELVAQRIKDVKAARDEEEAEMEQKKDKAHKAKHVRMTASDIQNEEPKNPGKGRNKGK